MRRHFSGEKWILGFALALVYIPLRTFINVPRTHWHTIPGNLPLFGVEILISTIFYTSWIYFADWMLGKLEQLTGQGENPGFKLSNQLIALVPAVLLAIIFNGILIATWGVMREFWDTTPRPNLGDPAVRSILLFRSRANQALTIMALLAAYYLCVNNRVQDKLKKLLVNSEKLEKENMRARFLALKNQISPHFLFNNLSVLSSLVESQPDKSSEFVQQLSSAYRYILEQSELDKISLRDEMKFLETYVFLLQTRFKDKVMMEADLPPGALDRYYIIPLTLQLLVENAVKHNTMSKNNPLVIRISADDDMLFVSNPLQLRQLSEPTTRLGLPNIINRYKLLQNKEVIVEKTDDLFTVKIPLIA